MELMFEMQKNTKRVIHYKINIEISIGNINQFHIDTLYNILIIDIHCKLVN